MAPEPLLAKSGGVPIGDGGGKKADAVAGFPELDERGERPAKRRRNSWTDGFTGRAANIWGNAGLEDCRRLRSAREACSSSWARVTLP